MPPPTSQKKLGISDPDLEFSPCMINAPLIIGAQKMSEKLHESVMKDNNANFFVDEIFPSYQIRTLMSLGGIPCRRARVLCSLIPSICA